ncbi:helix-turn-helix domain-containing protein [Streptomyces puniciscabiei]|uniref:helix-turn-helix domain-containing protein n=1 Tax=Streptomyces puniciscabiei TaxID=164348 RepID=UPI003EC00539
MAADPAGHVPAHSGAAARLSPCHRNTVRHRLRRLEELTGRSLQDPRAVAEISVALHALRLLPPTPEQP